MKVATPPYKISQQHWGKADDKDVYLFRIQNESGAYIELSNYGASLISVYVPDKKGVLDNVVLGFSSLAAYVEDTCYLGRTIGPFANRIANASFELDGVVHYLEPNDSTHCNHSGSTGFHQQVFDFDINGGEITFSLLHEDGTGGFSGNIDVRVTYAWSTDNQLSISYAAQTDHRTIVNLTNHAYFNLAGGKQNIFNHHLTIDASGVLETRSDYIPTGRIIPIAGESTFQKTPIADQLDNSQKGINSCYVLKQGNNFAAELHDPQSGRSMQLFTSYPGLMLYTGGYLTSNYQGHHGKVYQPFDGLCLEAQYFPDSPNHPNFPSAVLHPGAEYQHEIKLKFNTQIK